MKRSLRFRGIKHFISPCTMTLLAVGCGLAMFSALSSTCLAQATGFTYQGRLLSAGTPVSSSAEFEPTLWDAATNGSQVVAHSPPILLVTVSNGIFVLPLDFGTAPFNAGANRWLQLQVRTGLGPYTLLTPRQKLTATPYALRSLTAANADTAAVASSANSVVASNISGTLTLAQLPGTVLTNNQTGVNLTGSFSGDGGSLSNISANTLGATPTDVSITGWGYNEYGQRSPPVGLRDVMALSVGVIHSLALKSNGTVVVWGANDVGQTNIPANLNNVGAIAAGIYHNLALRTDGTVVAWGLSDYGETNVPAGLNNVKAISAGINHSLALKTNGTVICWGANFNGQTNVPAGLSSVIAISAGGTYSLALKADGTVVAWGTNDNAQADPPAGLNNVIAIAAGAYHNLALKADGTVVAWGWNGDGQTNVPSGLSNVVAVGASVFRSIALKSDGTVVVWGGNAYGELDVPPGLNNVVALASGGLTAHVLVLRKRYETPVAWLDSDNTFNGAIEATDLRLTGDIRTAGEIISYGGLSMNEGDIWLRSDRYANGLGWYGTNKAFGQFAPDGPVLFGFAGGGLGTSSNGYQAVLTWDALQQVGIGTTNPHARLSLGSGFAQSKLLLHDTDTERVGLGVQANQFRLHLNTNVARFSFLNSAASTNDLLTIQGSGFVGIGLTNPATKLHLLGTDGNQLRLQNSVNNNYWTLYSESFNGSGNLLFAAGPTGGYAYFRKADGFYFNSSDGRLKRNITATGSVLDRLLQLRPVTYHMRAESENAMRTYGFIAQEVEPLFPEIVGDHAGMKAIAYSQLVPVTVAAIQELCVKLEARDNEIEKLKVQNASLEKRLQRLEHLISPGADRH